MQAHGNDDVGNAGPHQGDPPLVALFGPSGNVRILSAFLTARHDELTIMQIHETSGVARNTVYNNLEDLLELGVIEETRQRGRSQLYTLNMDSPMVEHIQVLEELVLQAQA